MEIRARTAVVDESFRRGSDGRGLFLLTAVIVPDDVQIEIERRVRRVAAPGQQRWHFRDENALSRRRFISRMTEIDLLGGAAVTYCCQAQSQRKAERARVRCLWNLLAELRVREVHSLLMESRQEHNDLKDRREIASAQRSGVASYQLAYRHGRPNLEPILWLPDAVAGAVGLSLADGNHSLMAVLPESMKRVAWIYP